mmetsp:Transcript_161365/g.512734  ORF Transcript_161365/g.512734 Transcript_161365/m.512734 type:complete len:725 (+) Transcript_161365:6445-8619(+)
MEQWRCFHRVGFRDAAVRVELHVAALDGFVGPQRNIVHRDDLHERVLGEQMIHVENVLDEPIENHLVQRILAQATLLLEDHLDLSSGVGTREAPVVAALGQREASFHVLGPQLQEELAAHLLRGLLVVDELVIGQHRRVQAALPDVELIRVEEDELHADAVLGPVILQTDLLARSGFELDNHGCRRPQLERGDADAGALHDSWVRDREQAHLLNVLHDPGSLRTSKAPADLHVGPGPLSHDLFLGEALTVVCPLTALTDDVRAVRVRAHKDDCELGSRRSRPPHVDPQARRLPRHGAHAMRRHVRGWSLEVLVQHIRELVDAPQCIDGLGSARVACRHRAVEIRAQRNFIAILHLMRSLEYQLGHRVRDDVSLLDVVSDAVAVVAAEGRAGVGAHPGGQVSWRRPGGPRDLLAIQWAIDFDEGEVVRCAVRVEVVVRALAGEVDDTHGVVSRQAVSDIGEAEVHIGRELPALLRQHLRALDRHLGKHAPIHGEISSSHAKAAVVHSTAVAHRNPASLVHVDRPRNEAGVIDNPVGFGRHGRAGVVEGGEALVRGASYELTVIAAVPTLVVRVRGLLAGDGRVLNDFDQHAVFQEAECVLVVVGTEHADDAWLVRKLDVPLRWEIGAGGGGAEEPRRAQAHGTRLEPHPGLVATGVAEANVQVVGVVEIPCLVVRVAHHELETGIAAELLVVLLLILTRRPPHDAVAGLWTAQLAVTVRRVRGRG